MAAKKKAVTNEIIIEQPKLITMGFKILGTSPFIYNRNHNWMDLIIKPPKKTTQQMQSTPRSDPYEDYRLSCYRSANDKDPTLLVVPARMFKAAMKRAAIDIQGLDMTVTGRLIWVEGEDLPLYGIPQLLMAPMRQAGKAKTPMLSTRAVVPAWATEIQITFDGGILTETSVANLLARAGIFCGVGDSRQEKGYSSFGQFEAVSANNLNWKRVVKESTRIHQASALDSPNPPTYDEFTADHLRWFDELAKTRGIDTAKYAEEPQTITKRSASK